VWGPGLAAVISLFTISGWLLTRGTLERLHLAWADLRPIAWGVLKFAALLAILAVAGSTVSAPDQGWPRFLLVTTGFLCFAVLVASLLDWALVRFFLGGAREPQLLGISAAKQSGMDPS
jgi:hypothetical protein